MISQPGLYQISQTQPNGGWYTPALLFGTGVQQIATARRANGSAAVLFTSDDSLIYYAPEANAVMPGAPFAESFSLGVSAKQIVVDRNPDDLLECFYIDLDDNINYIVQTTPGATTWANGLFGGKAKQLALARNPDGHLELFYIGLDDNIYDFWANGDIWQGGIFRGQAKRIALAVNTDGHLELIYIGMNNRLYHNWQATPGHGPWKGGGGGSAASALGGLAKDLAWGLNQNGHLEIFYIGTNDAIYHNWQDGNGWNGEVSFGGFAQQLCPCQDKDGRLELFYVGLDGFTWHSWQVAKNGPWIEAVREHVAGRLASINDSNDCIVLFYFGYDKLPTGTVPPPASGLIGPFNYIISNNCDPLLGVEVVIDVTEDISYSDNGAPGTGERAGSGFGWQLNCFSPVNYLSTWQQYCLVLVGNILTWKVNNWESGAAIVINTGGWLAEMPDSRVPAGYRLSTKLQNDIDGNVTAVIFSVMDGAELIASHLFDLRSQLKTVELAPIVAAELNLVGPFSEESVVFSSGAGTITYSASTALTALSAFPPCAAWKNPTGETSNATYGPIDSGPSWTVTQSFGFDPSVTMP